jgi:hypothetical protein
MVVVEMLSNEMPACDQLYPSIMTSELDRSSIKSIT